MPNICWYFIILVLIIYKLKNNNYTMYIIFSAVGILLLIVCSTSYIPKKLVNSIEKNYAPISLHQLDTSKTYYIHVLGAGSSSDAGLPASMNLSATTLIRLVEGIRNYNQLKHAVLVTSAAATNQSKSQAKLAKEAAMALGVKEQNIQMLETPTSTMEEAIAFKEKFGTNKNVILVTSAIHMPRAVEIFTDQGIKTVPAPTDYQYKEEGFKYSGITFPTLSSLNLCNSYQTAVAKHLYYRWLKKPKK
jgi:uncharacterized SAM-binding protein YcdF (DUF218 family)